MRRRLLAILTLLSIGALAAVPASGQDTSALQRDIDAKLRQEATLGSQAQRLGRIEARLTRQVNLLQGRLSKAQEDLDRADRQLDLTQGQLRDERARALRLRNRLTQTKEALANLLRERFMSGTPDLMTVVLNADGFADLLDRAAFLKRVQDRDTQIVGEVKSARAEARAESRRLARLEKERRIEQQQVQERRDAINEMTRGMEARRDQVAQARAARLALKHATAARRKRASRTLNKLLEEQRKAFYSPGPGGPWAIPWAIVQCESGGRNVPPNWAGASGYYQFMPATWKGLGGSTSDAYKASKAEQDRLAAKLWDGGRGARNWDCAAIVGLLR